LGYRLLDSLCLYRRFIGLAGLRVQTIGDIVPFGLHFDNVRLAGACLCFFIGVNDEKTSFLCDYD
jgi:hypothetical protein